MSKAQQLELFRKASQYTWLPTAFLAGITLLPVWFLLHERHWFDRIGLLFMAGICLMFMTVIQTGSRMLRRGIAALETDPITTQVRIEAKTLDDSVEYTAWLDWHDQPYKLPLATQERILKPLANQTLEMRVYADRDHDQPVMLETPQAYLWLKAPARPA